MAYVVCPERKGFPRINTQVCRVCKVNPCKVRKEVGVIRYPKYFRRLMLSGVVLVPKNEFTFLNLEGSEECEISEKIV